MVDLIDLRCPECGAHIKTSPHSDVATCEYCGLQVQVRRRKGLFQRPAPPKEDLPHHVRKLPVALQARARRLDVLLVVIGIVTAAPVPIIAMLFSNGPGSPASVGSSSSNSSSSSSSGSKRWDTHPIPVDVNADDTTDVMGMASYWDGGKSKTGVFAIDGKTGKLIWEKAFDFDDVDESNLAIVGNVWLLAKKTGVLTAYRLRDAKQLWRATVGKQVDTICAGDHDTAILRTSDHHDHEVALADGRVTDVETARCRWTPTNDYALLPRGVSLVADSFRGENHVIPQMSISSLYLRRADGLLLATGWRPGTHVNVIERWGLLHPLPPVPVQPEDPHAAFSHAYRAAVDAYLVKQRAYLTMLRQDLGQPTWKVVVVEGDAKPEVAMDGIGIGPQVAVVSYDVPTTSPGAENQHGKAVAHVAAYALADGKRLWDVEVPGVTDSAEAVWVTRTRVFMKIDGSLVGLDVKDGKEVFRFGGR